MLPSSQVDWQALLAGLASGLWEECNLSGEADRQRRFRVNMAAVPGVMVPAVFMSCREVMVSEWVEGVPLRALAATDPALKLAQARMRDAYCQSMFVDGFFHADCHGGNLLWVPASASLCILDCGLMVEIEAQAARALLRLSLNLASREWAGVVEDAVALGFLPADLPEKDRMLARGVARRILGPYLDVGGGARGFAQYSLTSLFNDLTSAAAALPTALPPEQVLLGRAVIQLEGLALRAYPDYRLVDDILPVAARLTLQAGILKSHLNNGFIQ